MDDDEIAALLDALERLLFDLDLGFIVAQERVIAAEGESKSASGLDLRTRRGGDRPYSTEIPPPELPLFATEAADRMGVPSRGLRLSSEDVVVTPLGPSARLALLLDLIETATAGTLAMERFVFSELVGDGAGAVVFADPDDADLPGTPDQSWRLTAEAVGGERATRARVVVELLDGLRAEAGVARGAALKRSTADGVDDIWAPPKGST